jgi:hypothetical protein
MPTPIIKGTGAVIEKPYEVLFDPRRGKSVRRKWTQAGGNDALVPLEQEAALAGYSTRMLVSPVLSELEITSPEIPEGGGTGGNEINVVTDTWQLVGNEASRSRFQNPVLQAAVSYNDRAVIVRALRTGKKLEDAAADATADGLGTLVTPTDPEALQLYNQCQSPRNETDFTTFETVLIHTVTVGANSTWSVANNNVEKLFTTSQLLSEASSSALWVKPIPALLYNSISALPNRDLNPSDPEYDLYGWLWWKTAPKYETDADNRIRITTEYRLKLWSLLDYALAS